MQVTATKTGFYDGSRRRPGDVFDMPEGKKLPSWVVPSGAFKPAKAKDLNGDTKSAASAKAARDKLTGAGNEGGNLA
jgi:hypothetical protein